MQRAGRRRARLHSSTRSAPRSCSPGSTTPSGTARRASAAARRPAPPSLLPRWLYVRQPTAHRAADQLRPHLRSGFIDGWSWRMGHKGARVQCDRRAGEVASGPDCLLTDHTHLQDRRQVGRIVVSRGRSCSSSPAGNTYAGNQEQKDQRHRRQRLVLGCRHWRPDERHLISSTHHLLRPGAAVAQAACSTARPTARGLMDTTIVNRLTQVGLGVVAKRVAPGAARRRGRPSNSRTRRRRRPRPAATAANAPHRRHQRPRLQPLHDLGARLGALPQSITIDSSAATKPDVGAAGVYAPRIA